MMSASNGQDRSAKGIVTDLLSAIESRDLRAIGSHLSPDATWQNVPSPVVVGRAAVLDMLGGILSWSDRVRWDVVSASYGERDCWLERADRFWIDGQEHAVLCNGVFTTDPSAGVVTGVRDYVDLAEWRTRTAPVLGAMAERPPIDVVARHLAAVRRLDVVAMAADYGPAAELIRGGTILNGPLEIIDYFDTVPERLVGRELTMSEPRELADGTVEVDWVIAEESRPVSQGSDRYTVVDGRIARQQVTLAGTDF